MPHRIHRRHRHRVAAVCIAALALMLPTVANAIVYGEDDAGRHPNVGSLLVRYQPAAGDPYLIQWCTGTLMSERVVLTASHCLTDSELASGPGAQMWFTLDPVVDADGDLKIDANVTRLSGQARPHPKYAESSHYRYDVGAFLLDEPVTGVAFGAMATPGTLDDRALRGATFTTVGYGFMRSTRKKSTQAFELPRRRMMASQTLQTVTRDFATFSMNQATGNGGTCYGDSGGPHFSADGAIVAVTTTGDIPCKATDQAYRVDTDIAHDFIGQLVARYQ